jgi:hypothetical protein
VFRCSVIHGQLVILASGSRRRDGAQDTGS